jgi:hypothetical protein
VKRWASMTSLFFCLAEWVGRDLSGVDWSMGLPWRIENQITGLLKEINQDLEKSS